MRIAIQPEAWILVFDVKEAKVGTFSVGVSFNEADGDFGGILGFSDSNLMGLGQSISMDLNISDSRNNVQFSFTDPWMDDKHTSFGLSVWNTDSTITSTLTDWLPDSFNPAAGELDAVFSL